VRSRLTRRLILIVVGNDGPLVTIVNGNSDIDHGRIVLVPVVDPLILHGYNGNAVTVRRVFGRHDEMGPHDSSVAGNIARTSHCPGRSRRRTTEQRPGANRAVGCRVVYITTTSSRTIVVLAVEGKSGDVERTEAMPTRRFVRFPVAAAFFEYPYYRLGSNPFSSFFGTVRACGTTTAVIAT
jgi:hypothetical protein